MNHELTAGLRKVARHKWVLGEEAPPVFDGGIEDISSFPMEEVTLIPCDAPFAPVCGVWDKI